MFKRKKQIFTELMPWLLTALVAVIAIGTVKQLIKKHALNKELEELQRTAESIKQDNLELENLLSYIESSAYTEEQARLKFGLAAPGEKLAIVPQVAGASDDETDAGVVSNFANFWKDWWGHFFSNK
jgi:cell division protein FtsB